MLSDLSEVARNILRLSRRLFWQTGVVLELFEKKMFIMSCIHLKENMIGTS